MRNLKLVYSEHQSNFYEACLCVLYAADVYSNIMIMMYLDNYSCSVMIEN